jgi:hypothetical protein
MSFARSCIAVTLFGAFAAIGACSSSGSSSSGTDVPDADAAPDVGSPEAGSDAADGGGGDADAPAALQESEPNGGATTEEVDDLPLGASMQGGVQDPDDTDVFRVQTQPGKVYLAKLDVPAGSSLQGHLTVIDDGRNGKVAGDDFVKIAVAGSASSAELVFLAMGQGGHFVAVRDARNVQGQSVGGPGYDYVLSVVEADVSSGIEAGTLVFPSQSSGQLAHPAALLLHPFDGAQGTDVLFDLAATGDADFRLFVFSKTQADWIARNDDRSAGDPNPLIDAPLTAGGGMWLVVENIEPEAKTLGFSLSSSMP